MGRVRAKHKDGETGPGGLQGGGEESVAPGEAAGWGFSADTHPTSRGGLER